MTRMKQVDTARTLTAWIYAAGAASPHAQVSAVGWVALRRAMRKAIRAAPAGTVARYLSENGLWVIEQAAVGDKRATPAHYATSELGDTRYVRHLWIAGPTGAPLLLSTPGQMRDSLAVCTLNDQRGQDVRTHVAGLPTRVQGLPVRYNHETHRSIAQGVYELGVTPVTQYPVQPYRQDRLTGVRVVGLLGQGENVPPRVLWVTLVPNVRDTPDGLGIVRALAEMAHSALTRAAVLA